LSLSEQFEFALLPGFSLSDFLLLISHTLGDGDFLNSLFLLLEEESDDQVNHQFEEPYDHQQEEDVSTGVHQIAGEIVFSDNQQGFASLSVFLGVGLRLNIFLELSLFVLLLGFGGHESSLRISMLEIVDLGDVVSFVFEAVHLERVGDESQHASAQDGQEELEVGRHVVNVDEGNVLKDLNEFDEFNSDTSVKRHLTNGSDG
jgi:hypothetical protein